MRADLFEEYLRVRTFAVPSVLQDITCIRLHEERSDPIDPDVKNLLQSLQNRVLKVEADGDCAERRALRVGVILAGGPAPGGHAVISGLFDALHEWHPESLLVGFLGGPKGLLRNEFVVLSREHITSVQWTGGFSLLGTGRTKIVTDEEIDQAIQSMEMHQLDGLVMIGGDDSNSDAAYLAHALTEKGRRGVVVGVPKTIDGDLQSRDIEISFGFDTACKVYSDIIGNISQDLLSTKKYYSFVRLMGRTASHITLECALQTQPNLAFITEEIHASGLRLQDLISMIADLVEARHHMHKHYGLVLIPEGLIESLSDVRQLILELNELLSPQHPLHTSIHECATRQERVSMIISYLSDEAKLSLEMFPPTIAEQFVHDRDPHGNVRVSKIETERLLAGFVETELRERNLSIPFTVQPFFCGYEGRSAYPSWFDAQYCYSLGRVAALSIVHQANGYLAAIRHLSQPIENWEPVLVPLATLMQIEVRHGEKRAVVQKKLVDLEGNLFQQYLMQREAWKIEDCYRQAGPMQFWGPDDLVSSIALTVLS